MLKRIYWSGFMLVLVAWALRVQVFAENHSRVPETCIDLTSIFQATIALMAALIARLVIPWLKTKATQSKQKKLMAILQTLVTTAEEIYGAGTGDDKLNWVTSQVKEMGLSVDSDAIEAAVRQLMPKDGCSEHNRNTPQADATEEKDQTE